MLILINLDVLALFITDPPPTSFTTLSGYTGSVCKSWINILYQTYDSDILLDEHPQMNNKF